MTTKEKRENSRLPHNMPMEFIVQDHRYLGLIKSISKSGVFIETRELFKVGQVVLMTYAFPPFRGKNKIGKIISVGPQGIRVRFQRLKKKAMQEIPYKGKPLAAEGPEALERGTKKYIRG